MGGLGLASKRCTWPCDPTVPAYTREQALALVTSELTAGGWRLGTFTDCITLPGQPAAPAAPPEGTTELRLVRRVALPDFARAAALAQAVATVAEAEGHFPEVQFGWQYLEVSIFTHVVGGLCENDFILASKLDALLAEAHQPLPAA